MDTRKNLSARIDEAIAETRIPGEYLAQTGNGVKPAYLTVPVSATVARVVTEQRQKHCRPID
jgi:hypothetical protein